MCLVFGEVWPFLDYFLGVSRRGSPVLVVLGKGM